MKPDGILFSNGPGDPYVVPCAVVTVKELLGRVLEFVRAISCLARNRPGGTSAPPPPPLAGKDSAVFQLGRQNISAWIYLQVVMFVLILIYASVYSQRHGWETCWRTWISCFPEEISPPLGVGIAVSSWSFFTMYNSSWFLKTKKKY